ncbi:hypothetical protein RQP46_008579 [Phenoliferia psychrophenolica]
MKLTLLPHRSYPIPSALQSHILERPKTPYPRRAQPIAYRRSLLLEISSQSGLAHDKAAWWTTSVREVTWDLDNDQVVVEMIDGSVESWTFDERGLSEEAISLSPEFVIEKEDEAMEDQLPSSSAQTIVPATEQQTRRESAGHDVLRALSIELRSAYEDVSTPSPNCVVAGSPSEPLCAGSEYDWTELAELAADTTLKFPHAWSAMSTRTEWFHEEQGKRSSKRVRTRSATFRVPAPPPTESQDVKGQLPDHRRPHFFDISIDSPEASSSTTTSTTPPTRRHDFLSLVALLTKTRQTLLSLFSTSILPALKTRIPPTYSIWAATSVEKSLLRTGVRKAAEIARSFDVLQADSGSSFDLSDDDDESDSDSDWENEASGDDDLGQLAWERDMRTGFADEEDDDFSQSLGAVLSSPSSYTSTMKKNERVRRNPMWEMRDDYSLRNWCVLAQARARELERQSDPADGGEYSLSLSTDPLPVWEVSKSYPSNHVTTSLSSRRRKGRIWENPASSATTVSDGSSSDDDDDDSGSIASARSAFFYIEDPIEGGLLPQRLPKALLFHAPGREMEYMRQGIHAKLNEVAGIQKKIMELRDFCDSEQDEWDRYHASVRLGHAIVGTPGQKRKAFSSPKSGAAQKRKKENLEHVRGAAGEDQAQEKSRLPLGGVVAAVGKSQEPKGATILPPPNPSASSKRKADELEDESAAPPRRKPLSRSPSLMQPLDIPPHLFLPPESEPLLAQRLHISELASHRAPIPAPAATVVDEDDDDDFPFSSFKSLLLVQNASINDSDSDEDSDSNSGDEGDSEPGEVREVCSNAARPGMAGPGGLVES